jgi:serine/threonine protein kinase
MLSVGTVIATTGRTHKPKTAYEMIMAEDDGLLHDGNDLMVTEVVSNNDADISDLYRCQPTSFVKFAKRLSDNDLVENEARVLAYLNGKLKPDSTYFHYFPRLQQPLNHQGYAGVALSYAEEYVSLAEIIRAYPQGIDFRDMVWMFKRMLVALGFAHSVGVIHGAVVPSHVLVHPTGHGGLLIDWSYGITDPKEHIKAMSVLNEDFYPPEVRRREPPKTSTDLFMAAKCVIALLGGNVRTNAIPHTVPEDIRDFLLPCLDEAVRHRPHGAWDLHEQFDALLQKLVGKPTYRPFTVPK